MAENPEQVQKLDPTLHPEVIKNNPLFAEAYASAQTVVSQDIPAMVKTAENAANELRSGNETLEEMAQGNPRW